MMIMEGQLKKRTRIPSFSKIMTTDYPAFLASLSPIVVFFAYLVFLVVQRNLSRPLLPQAVNAIVYSLLGLTVVFVLYQIYRSWIIRRIFLLGSEVQGRISTVAFRRLGGWVGYTYSFGQQRIVSGAALRRNAHTKTLHKGDRVLIVVDRSNPKRAFICDLYR